MPKGQDSRGDRRRSVSQDRFVIGQPQRWSGYGSNVKAPKRTTVGRDRHPSARYGAAEVAERIRRARRTDAEVSRDADAAIKAWDEA